MAVREKAKNDKRLIDANAMLDDWLENCENEYVYDTNAVLDSIDSQPTVGSVEVVRCKDCKHYKPQKKSAHWGNRTNYCNRIVTIKVQPYDFCSYGERKEGAD